MTWGDTMVRERWERRRQAALQRDMLPSWYATRRRRRTLAAAGLAALAMIWAATAVSWNLAPSDTAMAVSLPLLGLSVVVMLPVVTLLNVATRGSMSLAERLLDERQVAERLRSFTVAHRVMLGILVVLAVVVLSTDTEDVPMASVALGVVGLFETHMLLPVLVAGWRQADPPPGDEEDEDL
ncbi:hypothetical protein E1293_42225 [Actinomadura darangshiensis]|uniref:Uncharacterized protein n=1 Tax=Actinomadura darangshiensis TaxID=705336 RepID=A0A4R4ZZ17_9ACTN|nr:hypothetical protein [Actinomadura darangshiensis]TDD63920.1 hypothetical protein E1293_42225 [Actinomadura darangshiensis]